MKDRRKKEDLSKQLEAVTSQLHEANEMLQAIRTGQVDALVVQGQNGPQLYTLKTADHTYRVFIEKMKEGAVTLNSSGIILYCNSQFASMVNLPLPRVIGLLINDFIPRESKSTFQRIIEEGWESDSKGEVLLRNINNELIPFLLSVTSIDLDEGPALSVILTDLTLQKENEKQLQLKNEQLEEARRKANKMNEELEDIVKDRTKDLLTSREYFKFLADNIPVIIWTTDASGTLDYVNRRWCEYTGLDLEESKDQQATLVHPEDVEKNSLAWKEAVRQKQKYEQQFRFRRASDGTYRWHYAQAIPFKNERNEITSWIGTSIDIDDQRRELERKDEFISVASHELKTPLTSLKGYMQLMEYQDDLSEETRIYVAKATGSLNKLQHLVDELLDASKIRAGKLNFTKTTVNLTELIRTCIESSKYMYPHYTIKTKLHEDIMVYGNEERLEQVLMNLLNNAVKYSPKSTDIIVQSEIDHTRVIVSVIDFGIGISEAYHNLVFERFYRINGNQHSASGLGMGLYISSEIIKEHHGQIYVKSKLNEGSVFSFSLPLASASSNELFL